MSIVPVGANAAGSLVAVGGLSVTKPAGLANGDLLLAPIATGVGVNITPPGGFVEVTAALEIGLSVTLYWKVVTDAAGEPATYDWSFALAVLCAGIVAAYRGAAGPWDNTITLTDVDGTGQSVTLTNRQLGTLLLTIPAGLRLALLGDGTTWTVENDPKRAEYSNPTVAGVDLSLALHDAGQSAPLGPISRTATASQTQTEQALVAVLLSGDSPTTDPSFLAEPTQPRPVIQPVPDLTPLARKARGA